MSTALTSSNPPKVFISYSHKDEEWLEKLEVYLKVLQDQNIITLLHSHRTVPGIDFAEEIEKNLDIAQIVLLLVSVDFLASYYCYRIEFERAMQRHDPKTVSVIPVILRPCNWKDTPLRKLQALPKGGKPIVLWDNVDEAFLNVTDGIKKVAESLRLSSIQKIEVTLDNAAAPYDQKDFEQRLSVHVAVDLNRITVSIQRGSIKIIIEGDNEELVRIVNALRDPELRLKLFEPAKLKSITYKQDQRVHSIPVQPPTPPSSKNDDDDPSFDPKKILRQAIRAVPAVKFALGVAGIAAAVAIVAGFSAGYKVAVLGTIIMLGLMFGLVSFSYFAFKSGDAIKPLALFLAWTCVILTSVTSVFIVTAFFFDWPRPLEAYIRPGPSPSPIPLPTPSPTPAREHSPTPTSPHSPTPTPEPTPTPTINPQIVITERPPYDPKGGPDSHALIVGKVSGVRPEDYCIVIYSFTNTWYVQPTEDKPRIAIGSDGTWTSVIHTGTIYNILLVPKDYKPLPTPTQMSGVVKSIEFEGKK
jgi:TIR domain